MSYVSKYSYCLVVCKLWIRDIMRVNKWQICDAMDMDCNITIRRETSCWQFKAMQSTTTSEPQINRFSFSKYTVGSSGREMNNYVIRCSLLVGGPVTMPTCNLTTVKESWSHTTCMWDIYDTDAVVSSGSRRVTLLSTGGDGDWSHVVVHAGCSQDCRCQTPLSLLSHAAQFQLALCWQPSELGHCL